MAATATGMKLRGVHSNSSSSTASRMAAIGVPNTVVMPAAAPATSSVLRSSSLTGSICANSEPIAPPVMMIGPSAPNGPPVPIEIADESGFRIATLASSRRRPEQDRLDRLGNAVAADLLAAVARHQADDQRAGHRHQHRPKAERRVLQLELGEAEAAEIGNVGGKPDQLKQRNARQHAGAPTMTATPAIIRTRRSVVKSPKIMAGPGGSFRFGGKDSH